MTCSYRPPESLPEWVNRPYLLAKQALREGRRLSPTASDGLTQELYQALRSRQATPGQNSGPRSGRCDADVARALEIHQSDQGTLRAQIEAYLLTSRTIKEIGERVDLAARVVEIYGVCFFDVRHQAHTSTLREVVEAYRDSPPDRLYQDYFWKTLALGGSIEMLEAIMSPATIQSVEEAATASAAEARFIFEHQIIEAARTIDATDPNQSRELRKIAEDMQEVQPKDEHTFLLEQIDQMCQSLTLAVGPPRPETATPAQMEFAETAVELGLEDTLRVGLGMEPRHPEQLRAIRFPTSPDDHEALKLPGTFGHGTRAREKAADNGVESGEEPRLEEDDIPVDTTPPPTDADPKAEPGERRNLSNMEATFKRERVQREQAAIQQRQADREKAAQEAAAKAEAAQEALKAAEASAKEAEMERLDRECEAFLGNTTGAARNRLWLAFRKRYPGYVPKEGRELLARFK